MNPNNSAPFRHYGHPSNRGNPAFQPRWNSPAQLHGQGAGYHHAPDHGRYPHQQHPHHHDFYAPQQQRGRFPPPHGFNPCHQPPFQQPSHQQQHQYRSPHQQQHRPVLQHQHGQRPRLHDQRHPWPRPQQAQQQGPRHLWQEGPHGAGFPQQQPLLPPPDAAGLQNLGNSPAGVRPRCSNALSTGASPQSGGSFELVGTSTAGLSLHPAGASTAKSSSEPSGQSKSEHTRQDKNKWSAASCPDPQCPETEARRSMEKDPGSEQRGAGTAELGAQCGGEGRVLGAQNEGQPEGAQPECPTEEAGAPGVAKKKKSSNRKKSGQGQGQSQEARDGGDQTKGVDKEQEQKKEAKMLYDDEMSQKARKIGINPKTPDVVFIPPLHFTKGWGQGKVKDTSRPPGRNDPDPQTSGTPTSDLAPDPTSDPTLDSARDLTSDLASSRAEQTVDRCLKVIAEAMPGQQMRVMFNYSFDNYLVNSVPQARKKHGELFQDEGRSASPAKARRVSPSTHSPSVCDDRGYKNADDTVDENSTTAAVEVRAKSNTPIGAGCDSELPSPTAGREVTEENVSPSSRHPQHGTEQGGPPASSAPSGDTSSKKKKKQRRKEKKNKGLAESATSHDPDEGDEAPSVKDTADAGHSGDRDKPSPPQASPRGAPQGPKPSPTMSNPWRRYPKPRPLFPKPEDLEENRGDVDMLAVHQDKGCIIMEIKAVGYNSNTATTTSSGDQLDDSSYEVVRSKVLLALQQLLKAEKFVRHVFSDLMEELPVKKAMALPNVTRRYILDALSGDDDLQQKLCCCFGTQTAEEALARVLCADDIDSSVQSQSFETGKLTANDALLRWWENVLKEDNSGEATCQEGAGVTGPGQRLSQDVFDRMVGRLAGPYSRVTIESCRGAAEARTVADCVNLTGIRFGRSILSEDQQRILDSKEQFVYITGPPGSGKTLLLGFKAMEWARQGDHVVVFIPKGSGWGKLISELLYKRIKEYASLPVPPSGHPQFNPRKRAKENENQFSLMPPPPAPTTATKQKVGDQQKVTGSKKAALDKSSSSTNPQAEESQGDPPLKKSCSGEFRSTEREARGGSIVPSDEDENEAAQTEAVNQTEHDQASSNPASSQTALPQSREDDPATVGSEAVQATTGNSASVHMAMVLKTQDTKEFVDDLLDRYSDRPLKILLDEGPNKIKDEILHSHLNDAISQMKASIESFSRVVQEGEEGCGESVPPGEWIKEREALIEKNLHHLHTIGERLDIFQPTHCKLLVTQTEKWQTMVNEIAEYHKNTIALLTRLGAINPNPDLGNEESSGERAVEVCSGNTQEAAKAVNLPPDASIPGPKGAGTQPDSPDNPGKRTDPTASDVASEPQQISDKSENLKGNQAGIKTDAQEADNGAIVKEKTVDRAENSDVEAGEAVGATDADKTAGTPEEDAKGSSNAGKSVEPQEEANDAGAGVDNAADLPTCTRRSTLAALEKLEGEMLDVSGRLFNAETQLDFLAVNNMLSELVKQKGKRDVCVWSSGVSDSYKPENFAYEKLIRCIRCPPTVQRVLDMVEKDMAGCPSYSYTFDSLEDVRFPLPTDGPEVKLLDHSGHVNQVKDILDCDQCGANLADYLVDTLGVGGSSGLQPDDVSISGSLDICSVQGRPLIRALEDKGIQLEFEQQGASCPPPYSGKAFVVGGCSFQGLEFKVVIFIPDVSRIPSNTSDVKQFRPGLPDWLKTMGRWNRCHLWFVASRCLSQLIVFHV